MLPLRIALIGFMACGKSSVGRQLAGLLSYDFVDLDTRIEEEEGRTVAEIFATEGEAGFRARESAALARCGGMERIVLATGGGAVLAPVNREILATRFRVIQIRISAEEAVKRASIGPRIRPLLDCEDPLGRAQELLGRRAAIYEDCADHTIDSGAGTSIRGTAEAIHGYLCSPLNAQR
jgi:shikimate kinase